jgi:hypothetical protein
LLGALSGRARSVAAAGAIDTIKTCNLEFDATVFESAQNKPNPTDFFTDVPVRTVLLAATQPR